MFPKCCCSCDYFDWAEEGFYGEVESMTPFCILNIIFPTKKQTCAKRKPIKEG